MKNAKLLANALLQYKKPELVKPIVVKPRSLV